MTKAHKILRCPKCIKKNKKNSLINYKNYLLCNNCDEYYPKYKGTPIMLTNEDDFYHIRKALLPARYRVVKFEN